MSKEHINLDKLALPFPANSIHWRVGATSGDKKTGIALAYVDARDVMQRLDEVVGRGNWQCDYPWSDTKRLVCRVGIKIGGEWIWKSNGAGDTQVEAEKGAFSDAFKRAAVLWGIAQYLYDLPNTWVELEAKGRSYIIKESAKPKLIKQLENFQKGIRGKDEQEPQKQEPEVSDNNDSSLEVFFIAIKALKTKDSAHQWKRDNQESIDSLGADKGKVMTEYLNKVKELK